MADRPSLPKQYSSLRGQTLLPLRETPRQKLAQEARQRDMQAANDSARNATQYAILINGGAATAILSFLANFAKTANFRLDKAAAVALVLYGFGVCFAAYSMWSSGQASAKFGLRWEAFLANDWTGEDKWLKEADRWLKKHRACFYSSIGCFFISTSVIAIAWGLGPATIAAVTYGD